MKFCKDCKHCCIKYDSYICIHPNNIESKNTCVSGEDDITYRYYHCKTQRSFKWLGELILGVCGESGRWFESKENR